MPSSGVNQAAVQVLSKDGLCLIWSEVDWPLDPDAVQRNAVEFHAAVTQIFSQTIVAPFRLLTMFESRESLAEFASRNAREFLADLQRLRNTVQMECVIFFKLGRQPDTTSGQAYLRQKAELRWAVDGYVADVRRSLAPCSREVRSKEVNSGARIFCLLERGREEAFRSAAQSVAVPAGLERRLSGPWPPAEFLSPAVKMPQPAGKQGAAP